MAVAEITFIIDPDGSGDYLSIEGFEAAEATNALIANDEQYTARCISTGGSADTVACSFSTTWATDATHFIKVWTDPNVTGGAGPNSSYRHAGVWPSGNIFRMSVAAADALALPSGAPNFIRFIGLAIEITGTGSTRRCLLNSLGGGTTKVEQCVFRAASVGATDTAIAGIFKNGATNVMQVSNNVFLNFRNNTAGTANAGVRVTLGTAVLYNNTARNCANGYLVTATPVIIARNNIAQDCVTAGFSGTFDTAEYNCADDGTEPGTNSQAGEVTFVNEGAGDLHLDRADTVARMNGLNLSADATYPITVDIDNQTRSAWDIGADEFGYLQSISLNTAALTVAGTQATVTPGARTVSLDTGALAIVGQNVTITPGAITVQLDTATLVITGNDVTVTPGARTVNLDTAALVIEGEDVVITPGARTVTLDTAELVINGQDVVITPGARSVTLDTAHLVIQGNDVTITPGAVLIALETGTLSINGNDVTVTPGERIVLLETAVLTITGSDVTIETSAPEPPSGPLDLPPDRSFPVGHEFRIFLIEAEPRLLIIQQEARTFAIDPETRMDAASPEDREVNP